MAKNQRSDAARGRTQQKPLTNPDTGHTVVPMSEAVANKFRSRGYKATSGTSDAKKTTARATTTKTTATRKTTAKSTGTRSS